jgi:ribonuclease BN (tRNA processing enzyme)
MKPCNYRGASAIYYVNKQRGILMDCAEGSYGQLFDHLGTIEKLDDALLKTKVVFITHIHGDHQLGILKILTERDRLITEETKKFGKIYAVIPTPLIEFFNHFIDENIQHKDMVVLVPSAQLNPESHYYYQTKITDYFGIQPEDSLPHAEFCNPVEFPEIDKRIKQF